MRNSHVVSLQGPFQLQPESYAWYAIHFDEIKGKWSDINQAKEIAKNHEETSKAKAEEFIKRAEQQAIDKILRAEKVAISKVNEEIVANSVNIAEKIIIENINEQSSKKLVEQSISQINKLKT